jgi:acyl-coenzyme A synthetase/AMP-(fatty) acid ligase
MAHFAVPRYVEYVPELPKTPTNRIEKYRLQELGITENTWDREMDKKLQMSGLREAEPKPIKQ